MTNYKRKIFGIGGRIPKIGWRGGGGTGRLGMLVFGVCGGGGFLRSPFTKVERLEEMLTWPWTWEQRERECVCVSLQAGI